MIRRLLALALLLPSLAWADSYSTVILADSPRNYWRMDAASGTTEQDLGASAENGTYNGGVTLNQAGALTCCTDKAALFNGSTGYMIGSSSGGPSSTLNVAYSVEFWVKTDPAQSVNAVPLGITNGAGLYSTLLVGVLASTKMQAVFYNACASADTVVAGASGTWADDGNWYYVTLTTIGTGSGKLTAHLYVNAVDVASVTNSGTNLCTATTYTLNAMVLSDVVPSNFVNGVADEIATYNSVLSSASVTAHYNAGNAAAGLPTMGRRIFQSRRTIVSPYFLPVAFGVREPQAFPLDAPTFVIDRLNRRAIRSREVYAH